MEHYNSLTELLEGSERSRELFSRFSMDAQIAIIHQQQTVHTYEDLKKLAQAFSDEL